jgi:hypothetical protein
MKKLVLFFCFALTITNLHASRTNQHSEWREQQGAPRSYGITNLTYEDLKRNGLLQQSGTLLYNGYMWNLRWAVDNRANLEENWPLSCGYVVECTDTSGLQCEPKFITFKIVPELRNSVNDGQYVNSTVIGQIYTFFLILKDKTCVSTAKDEEMNIEVF